MVDLGVNLNRLARHFATQQQATGSENQTGHQHDLRLAAGVGHFAFGERSVGNRGVSGRGVAGQRIAGNGRRATDVGHVARIATSGGGCGRGRT